MSKPLTIDTYTAAWDAAMRPTAPRVGSMVRISTEPDGREMDGFSRVLDAAGMDIEWRRWMPRLRMDVHRVVRRA